MRSISPPSNFSAPRASCRSWPAMTRAWWRLLARLVCRSPPFSALVWRREGLARRVCLELHQSVEGGIDLPLGAGFQNLQLYCLRARRFPHAFDDYVRLHIVWVHQQGDDAGLRDHLRKQLETLGRELGDHHSDAGQVAARPGKAGDEAALDRVRSANEYNRNRRGRVLRRSCRSDCVRCDHVDLAADKIGCQCRELLKATFCPTVFNRDVLSFDVARFFQSAQKRGHLCRIRGGRRAAKEADNRHRRLLRAQRARNSRRAQQEQQLAPPHLVTSSARGPRSGWPAICRCRTDYG